MLGERHGGFEMLEAFSQVLKGVVFAVRLAITRNQSVAKRLTRALCTQARPSAPSSDPATPKKDTPLQRSSTMRQIDELMPDLETQPVPG